MTVEIEVMVVAPMFRSAVEHRAQPGVQVIDHRLTHRGGDRRVGRGRRRNQPGAELRRKASRPKTPRPKVSFTRATVALLSYAPGAEPEVAANGPADTPTR